MYNIIGQRKYFYILSGALIVSSIISLSAWGLRYGLDFTGGTLMEIRNEKLDIENDEIKASLKEIGIEDAVVTPAQNGAFLIRYGNSDDEKNKAVLGKLKEKFPDVQNTRLDYIGPSISSELKKKAIWALLVAVIGIALYISYAFRKVSRPVEWRRWCMMFSSRSEFFLSSAIIGTSRLTPHSSRPFSQSSVFRFMTRLLSMTGRGKIFCGEAREKHLMKRSIKASMKRWPGQSTPLLPLSSLFWPFLFLAENP